MLGFCIPFFVAVFVLVVILFLMAMFFSEKVGSGIVMDVYRQESVSSIQSVYIVKVFNEQAQESNEFVIPGSMRPRIKKGEEIVLNYRLDRITHLYEKNGSKPLLEALSAQCLA